MKNYSTDIEYDESDALLKKTDGVPKSWKSKLKSLIFHKRTQFIRFVISGTIGTALFYLLYEFLYFLLQYAKPLLDYRASISWFVSYVLSILWQHALHRYLVFGTQNSYWKTLFWTYVSYTLSLVISPAIIYLLVDYMGMYYQLGWVISLCATGLFNWVTLKFSFSLEGGSKPEDKLIWEIGRAIEKSKRVETEDKQTQTE